MTNLTWVVITVGQPEPQSPSCPICGQPMDLMVRELTFSGTQQVVLYGYRCGYDVEED